MKLVICGPDDLLKELNRDHLENCSKDEACQIEADVLLYLYEDGSSLKFKASNVIIHSVSETLKSLKLPSQIFRINAWPGFIKRETWEIAGSLNAEVEQASTLLKKKFVFCADEPGFIAARVLAMIINEAWYAKEEGISSEKEIDLAMKLGTGYPYGPFEWGNQIGFDKVYSLLNTLSQNDDRYKPCSLLKNSIGI